MFEQIIVSTDSPEIADIARGLGAEVPFFRPAEISDDATLTAPVLSHALDWLRENRSLPASFCCIYPTSPFLRADFLRWGCEKLEETGAAVAFSITSFPYPIMRGLRLAEENRLEMVWPEHENTRSQELEESYHDAGQFYWFDTVKFLEEPRMLPRESAPVHLPRYLVQDIDTPEDWEVAERMYRAIFEVEGEAVKADP